MKNHKYIIADHARAICMMINDGVMPSGKQRGYVLRRLIRRLLSSSIALKIDISNSQYFADLVSSVVSIYSEAYEFGVEKIELINNILIQEAIKYKKAIATGEKEWSKLLIKNQYSSKELSEIAFNFYQSLGVPLELSEDILDKNQTPLDIDELNKLIENHQQLSTTTSQGQFKSGLGENNETTTQMHTATHILHQVLRSKYGNSVRQMGSAITTEKARFDFSLPDDKELKTDEIKLEVNNLIKKNLSMKNQEVSLDKAKELGAIGLFGEKYGDIVSVYHLEDALGKVYSIEFCGGPHVGNTSEIKNFNIIKTKSLGQGVKRIEFTVN
jgi:alanyl-tRNA synthetase